MKDISMELTKQDDQTKKDAERGWRGGHLMMATVGASTDRKSFWKQSIQGNPCKVLLVFGLVTYLIFISYRNQYPNCEFLSPLKKSTPTSEMTYSPSIRNSLQPTNLSHLVFGLLGSVNEWHYRKAYTESWWRPNVTRGLLYLDRAPTEDLLPWSTASPPYRVSDNLTRLLQETKASVPVMIRMVHGIMEVMRDVGDHDNLRWLVMGDDDSLFFVDNMVDVLSQYDHTKYYYLGGQSESIMSGYWFSFNQGFGGAGFMLSYPLAKILADGMDSCLRRYAKLFSADLITMSCIADLGINVSPQKGIHQIDLHGDISGFLSSHPKFPIMSLHHFNTVNPLFPSMDRYQSTRHLMKAPDAAADQSRMLQQTICYYRQRNWSFSVSWGYSAHIYESIMPRSELQKPIETFEPWSYGSGSPPFHMFNTRLPSNNSCEAPHVFFFNTVERASTWIITTYTREGPRGLPPCNHTADFVSEILVFSPAIKRKEMDRCECCDIVGINGIKTELKFRECMTNEIIT